MAEETYTPYSTVTRYAEHLGVPTWAGPEYGERLGAYLAYQAMYDNTNEAFMAELRTDDDRLVLVPLAKIIVQTMSHFYMKGLNVFPEGDPTLSTPAGQAWAQFVKRERFYSKFHLAKHSGCILGDFILHLTGNEDKVDGQRVSLHSVHPSAYFPLYEDPTNPDRITAVRLAEQWVDPEDENKTLVKVLDYWFEDPEESDPEARKVWMEENIWEMEGWNNEEERKLIQNTIPPQELPEPIAFIPVFHGVNELVDGEDFGRSELSGLESMLRTINQTVTDSDIALALVGIGVYATDAGRPIDEDGNETDWIVAPGAVLEVPGATMIKKLEGISSLDPQVAFIELIRKYALEASGVSSVAVGDIDSQTAESGIALALRFLPTLAKLELRELILTESLAQFLYNWSAFYDAYETVAIANTEFTIELGEKLPLDRQKRIDELNNLLDRKVISRAFYRDEMRKLGIDIPATDWEILLEEERALAEAMGSNRSEIGDKEGDLPTDKSQGVADDATSTEEQENESNNKARSNESAGTEMDVE